MSIRSTNQNQVQMIESRLAWMLVAFMWIAYFLNYADRQAVFAIFPSLQRDLGMTDGQLGLTGAIFLWVYALGCPVAGQIADRWSKRHLVVVSLVLWSLVTIATGMSTHGAILLTLRGAMGISESLFMPTAIALTASLFHSQLRSRAISVLTTAQIAGTVFGSWYGGWMADQNQWRWAFYSLGLVGVLYALPYFRFLRLINESRLKLPEKPKSPTNSCAFLTRPTYLVLCFVFPIFVFGLWLIYGWFPLFLHDKFQLNQSDAAMNATLFLQASSAVGLVLGGGLADWLYTKTKASRMWIMFVSLSVGAPCLYFLGSSSTLAGTRVAACAFGLSGGLLMGNIFPAAFEIVEENQQASAVGVLNFCGGLVSGFAALFGGLWKSTLGIDRLLSVTAIAYILAAVILWIGIFVFFTKDQRGRLPCGSS